MERIQSAPYHTEVLYVPTSIIRVCCGSSIASIGGEMNAILITFSVGVQAPTIMEERRLKAPRPVATTA